MTATEICGVSAKCTCSINPETCPRHLEVLALVLLAACEVHETLAVVAPRKADELRRAARGIGFNLEVKS